MFGVIGAVIISADNPFHQRKSFMQDLEQYFEKEFKRFEKSRDYRKSVI